jgi:tRNA (guanine37-N1)-methyltransferase
MSPALEVGVVTLFPELVQAFLETSLVGRAIHSGVLRVELEDLRPHGLGKHLSVDDTPYGGGAGMLLRVDCVVAALENLQPRFRAQKSHRVLLTPSGARFTQRTAERWAALGAITLVCGRYEGFDDRTRAFVDEEACLGDFVVIGGEVVAMAMIEACSRLLPGVLGNEQSTTEESFSVEGCGLEYPQYTRPSEFRGLGVPEVLKNGHHGEIARWRSAQAEVRTRARRPDLLSAGVEGQANRDAAGEPPEVER